MATAVDELLSNVERDFILRALKEQQRVDGRQMLEPRPISMYFSRTEAQTYTEVQWGRTRCVDGANWLVGCLVVNFALQDWHSDHSRCGEALP